MRSWQTWDLPDDQAVIVHWIERDIIVVFPIQWAVKHGDKACRERAKERIAEFEGKVGRTVAPGSTLHAFSQHEPQPRIHTLAPEVQRRII